MAKVIQNTPETMLDSGRECAEPNERSPERALAEAKLRELRGRKRPATPEEKLEIIDCMHALTAPFARPLTLDEIREGLE